MKKKYVLKVSWFGKQIVKSWILPKNKLMNSFLLPCNMVFLEKIEDFKKAFQNYLTFKSRILWKKSQRFSVRTKTAQYAQLFPVSYTWYKSLLCMCLSVIIPMHFFSSLCMACLVGSAAKGKIFHKEYSLEREESNA